MRRSLLAALVAALMLSGCTDEPAAPGAAQIDVDTPQLRDLKADAGIEPCAPGDGDPVDGGLPEVALACLGGGPEVELSALRGPLILNLWGEWCGPCRKEMPAVADFYREHGEQVPVVGIDYQDLRPGPAIELARESGATYPQLADTQGALQAQPPVPARVPVPAFLFVEADGTATLVPGGIDSADELVDLANEHLGDRPVIPDWLEPVRAGAEAISAGDLTRFTPPPGGDARRGAVLMLFGEGPEGGELLLTERAHDMRSHPGQVSFPGGAVDPGETVVEAALREAHEEIGLEPGSVEVFGRLPELWLPPSNFAVTPILGWWREPAAVSDAVSIVSPAEVHAIHHAPIDELLDPEHRISVQHPRVDYRSPGFLIGPDKDVILWGFTGGIIARLFDYLGWTRPWDETRVRDLPDYMLQADPRRARLLDIEDDPDEEDE